MASCSWIAIARATGMRLARRQSQTEEWLTLVSRAKFPTLPAAEMISSTVIAADSWNLQPSRVKHFVGGTNAPCSPLCQPHRMASTTLGERFSGLRAEKSAAEGREISVDEAADAIGISRSFLSGIENDHDKPGRDSMIAAANYYGVSTDWLASGEGDPRPSALQERTARLAAIFEKLGDRDKEAVEGLAETLARR